MLFENANKIWAYASKECTRIEEDIRVNNNFTEPRLLQILEEFLHLVKYTQLNAQCAFHLLGKFDKVLEAAQFNLVYKLENNGIPQLKELIFHQNLVNQYLELNSKVQRFKGLQTQPVVAALELLENHFLLCKSPVLAFKCHSASIV